MTYIISYDILQPCFIEVDLYEALVYIIDIMMFLIVFVSYSLL